MEIIFKIFITGLFVLVLAILTNMVAQYFGINTWYGFIEEVVKGGAISTIKEQNILSLLFLFLIYPLALGFAGYFGFSFFK